MFDLMLTLYEKLDTIGQNLIANKVTPNVHKMKHVRKKQLKVKRTDTSSGQRALGQNYHQPESYIINLWMDEM